MITLVPSVYCLRPSVTKHLSSNPRCRESRGVMRLLSLVTFATRQQTSWEFYNPSPAQYLKYYFVNNNIWLVSKVLLLRPVRRLNKRHPENFTFFKIDNYYIARIKMTVWHLLIKKDQN